MTICVVEAIFISKGYKMEYSVLTYNIGGYEIIHEIDRETYEKTKDYVEYIYVTDDHSITSNTWNVVYVDDLSGSTFDKCYQIRFQPFKYVHNDIVIRIDGSMGILRPLDPIIEYFDKYGYDAGVMIHPTRNIMYDEYVAWVRTRGYNVEQANKCLQFMANNKYDVRNYKGLYQFNFMVQRNDHFNNEWNRMTYKSLQALATEPDTCERIDQTIGSFILNNYFNEKKIMPVGQYICNGMFFHWYQHNSNNIMNCDDRNNIEPFLFDKPTYLAAIY